MFKKQKNIILILTRYIIFLLIQSLLVCPGFALNIDISSPEHLSPRISISNSGFFDLIKSSCAGISNDLSDISHDNNLNLLDSHYQKRQRVVLQIRIIDNFEKYYPDNSNELELIKIFFEIAEQQYGNMIFETGEFFYNHGLEFAANASDNKAGFIEILAAIFHRMPKESINSTIDLLFKKLALKYEEKQARSISLAFQKKELVEITKLTRKFLKIDKLGYHVSSQGANTVENFMGAIINIMEGDFRLMRLLLAHKNATIQHASETRKVDLVKEIQNIYGPFAGRFGLFADKKILENDMFKIHYPKDYAMIMQKVRNTYGLDHAELNSMLKHINAFVNFKDELLRMSIDMGLDYEELRDFFETIEINSKYKDVENEFKAFFEKEYDNLENVFEQALILARYNSKLLEMANVLSPEYINLNASLEEFVEHFYEIVSITKIDVKIMMRLKSPYRIDIKEQDKGQGKKLKDTLFSEDTIGIKILCKTNDCYDTISKIIKYDLEEGILVDWKKKYYKGPENFERFTDEDGVPLPMNYMYLGREDWEGSVEVQFLTEKSDNLRELYFSHWAFEIEKKTGFKQKFENSENFGFYQLIEEYKKSVDNSKELEIDMDAIVMEYFKSVYENNKKWVYVFEKSTELIDGVLRDVVKPKRLLRGANGPSFAAQTGVDLFGPDYDGIIFYEWKGRELVAKKMQFDDLRPLSDGDIVEVHTSPNSLYHKCKNDRGYKDKVFASIGNNFLRAKVLLKHIASLDRIKTRDIQTAKDYLLLAFNAENIRWGESGENRFPDKNLYMQKFLNAFCAEKKLMTIEELYIALSLNASELTANEVVDWAKKRGIVILNEELDLAYPGIMNKLKKTYSSLDKLYIELGIGKITPAQVVKDLESKKIISVLSGQESGTFRYKMTFGNNNNRGRVVAQIATILTKNKITIATNFNGAVLKNIKNKNKSFDITFDIPLNSFQLSKIDDALTAKFGKTFSRKKVKVKNGKKKDFITLGLIVSTPTDRSTVELMRKIGAMQGLRFIDCRFNLAKKETICIISFDPEKLNPAEIENKLGLLDSQNLRFVNPEKIMSIEKIDKKNKVFQSLFFMERSI